jgi:hypothetical protein
MPPPTYVVPVYVFPVPKVSVLEPVPVAAVESVTVFPLIEATVVPGAIPPPVTACPTESTDPSATVTLVVPSNVAAAVVNPPVNCTVPDPIFNNPPLPPPTTVFTFNVPVPFCWIITSPFAIPN